MPDPSNDPPVVPPVQDKRVRPAGVLPKNTQALVLGAVAFLMVAVIAFSGRNAPKEKSVATSTPAAAVVDPSAARIEEYQHRVEEQTRKLQAEQAELARSKQIFGGPASARERDPNPYLNPGYSPAPRYATIAAEPEDSTEADMKKREIQSRFASNVALSYRKELSAPSASPVVSAAIPPSLLGYLSSLTAPMTPAPSAPLPGGAVQPGSSGAGLASEIQAASSRDKTADERDPKGRTRDAELDRLGAKRYRLFEGTVIETALTNRLDGSYSGPVNCIVTTDVYSFDGQHLLIPQGSRALGEVRKVDTFGQQRLAVYFHRLIMPDGYSVSLDKFHGLNQIGETGLLDQVNHHYLQVFGVSLAIGAIAGLSQAGTRYGADSSAEDTYRQGVANSLSQSSLRILDRYLNVLPTFTIREGHRVKVYLSDDVLLPAYEKHELPNSL